METFAEKKCKVIDDMKITDTEQLKLLCLDHISHVKIVDMDINKLLENLKEQTIVTDNKYDFLIECLILIGRLDIAKAIGCNDPDIKVIKSNLKEYKSFAGLKSFTILLHTLAANMEESDVNTNITCLRSDSIPKRELSNCCNGFQFMLLLRKFELINEDNLQHLSAIVRRPNLQKKIALYEEKTSKNLNLSSPSGVTAQSKISSKPEAGSMEENKSKKDEDFKETVVEENTSKHGNVSPPVHHPKQPAISTDHGTENTSKHGNVSPPVDPLKELAISTDHGTENASKHGNVSPPVHHLKQPAIPSERETAQTLQKYKMDAKPRGICLIFNNVNFQTDELKERTGSDADRDKLKKVFTSFYFEITVFEDLTKTEMEKKLEEFAAKDHTGYDCFVCCILSHGTKSKVYGVDGKGLDYETVISMFQSSKCNSLVGKPKLFFIQACQGKSQMTGVKIEFDGSSPSASVIPNVADFLMAFATFQGYVSIRHPTTGTWFIQNLCKVLNEHSRTTDLSHMMLLVNASVAKKEAEYEGETCKQMPSLVSTLRKKLFFLDTL